MQARGRALRACGAEARINLAGRRPNRKAESIRLDHGDEQKKTSI